VAAVQTAGGRPPAVAGKPEAAMAALVRARYADPVVMIGDRPSTDGAFAVALGVPFALVLSGIVGSDGEEPVPEPAPAFVAADLGTLAPQLVRAFGRA
jgi:ribonucleotide monophosphatase NagD (HAD superfamily)